MRRHALLQMVAIGVIASAVGIFVGLQIDWFPAQASTRAPKVDQVFDVLLIASVPIFVGVVVVILFSVWKFRMKPGEGLKDGPPIHGNTRLEAVWTTIPAMLVVGLVAYSFVVLRDIERKQPNTLVVHVVARQFAWTFDYPRSDGPPIRSSTLFLPVDRPILFRVDSLDVIHSFWVPQFRAKIDAVPGLTTTLRIKPSRRGRYVVVCAELCGLGHALMRAPVLVVGPARFRAWLARQKAPPRAPAAGAGDGRQVFVRQGCGSCHTLSAARTSGTVGPNLDKALADRSAAFIRQSIVDPNAAVEKGFPAGVMPQDFGTRIPTADLDALVRYLHMVTRP